MDHGNEALPWWWDRPLHGRDLSRTRRDGAANVKHIGKGRIQFSVRSLLITTAVLAFSLAPVVWVTRERRQMLRAREEAIRSVLLAERRRVELRDKKSPVGASTDEFGPDSATTSIPPVSPDVLIEHLRRENDELKDTVDSLRLEVQRLRAASRK
jgi:hypothetical protein